MRFDRKPGRTDGRPVRVSRAPRERRHLTADFARLASIVGLDRARFLAITGEVISADEAFRIGLVHEMKPADALDETVEKWARRIVSMEPEAVAWFRSMALAMEHPAASAPNPEFQIDCLLRPEFRRRVEDFLRK